MGRRTGLIAPLLMVALAWTGDASDAGAKDGQVSAVVLKEMPPGMPVAVELADDSDFNLQLKDRLERELAKQGVLISGSSPFELLFETRMVEGHFNEARRSFGTVEGSRDRGSSVQMNIWSNRQNSLFGGRRESGPYRITNLMRLAAELRDRSTLEVLWQGEALGRVERNDEREVAAALVPFLAQSFGKTIDARALDLR